ncbi:MAG: diguanylate cyclase [Firmicutes bacterium]|nr:diguanylate cyclase [Bacillota bacterium]
MARIKQKTAPSGMRILLIDDQQDYLESTIAILQREGHEVLGVTSGEEGLELLKKEHFDLLLVDYYMPGGMTGEEVVNELRHFNRYTQVILQTGYAGEHPPREMLKKLDIQGYHDKTDGPEKLLMWVEIGLKTARTLQLLSKSKSGLKYILDITPELHKIQQIQDICQGILYQIAGLVGIVNTFIATAQIAAGAEPSLQLDGFVATFEDSRLVIQAATGKFSRGKETTEYFSEDELEKLFAVLREKQIHINKEKTIIPLVIGEESLGCIYLDQPVHAPQDVELLQVFANQAALAIQNATLYEMATLDPLTGVFVRRVFDRWLLRDLRTNFRDQTTLTLLMIDVDGLKTINDSAGHLVGDRALAAVGRVLMKATRATDFVSRYGGDEFAILLSNTPVERAEKIAERILQLLRKEVIEDKGKRYPLRASIGICSIKPHVFKKEELPTQNLTAYFKNAAELLIKKADEMLYVSKRKGGEHVHTAEISWPRCG